MTTVQLLTKAIKEKKTVSFFYNREGKIQGERIGNPHVVYINKLKDGTESTKLDLYQIDGVSDRVAGNGGVFKEQWGMFFTEDITDVKLLNANFEPAPGYNPESEKYNLYLEKV